MTSIVEHQIRPIVYNKIELDTISNGIYTFEVPHADPSYVTLDFFHFVDADNQVVAASSGSVNVRINSSKNAFEGMEGVHSDMVNGSFAANTAHLSSFVKPTYRGPVREIRIDLVGIVAPGIGFKGIITQRNH